MRFTNRRYFNAQRRQCVEQRQYQCDFNASNTFHKQKCNTIAQFIHDCKTHPQITAHAKCIQGRASHSSVRKPHHCNMNVGQCVSQCRCMQSSDDESQTSREKLNCVILSVYTECVYCVCMLCILCAVCVVCAVCAVCALCVYCVCGGVCVLHVCVCVCVGCVCVCVCVRVCQHHRSSTHHQHHHSCSRRNRPIYAMYICAHTPYITFIILYVRCVQALLCFDFAVVQIEA